MIQRARALVFVPIFVLASAAAAQDWKAVADTDTIAVVTHDADGTPRETTIWLAVYEGHGYIRTGGTKWGANLKRDADLLVKIGGDEFPLRVAPIPESDPTYAAVNGVFRQKYGFSDAAIGLFRDLAGTPTIMRLDPR